MPLNGSKALNPSAGKWLLPVSIQAVLVTLALNVVKYPLI